ncbi:MAG TPA: hypothetical protein VM733_03570 [Thermoanaerobaculia bacterium]|nr:hypothetical protein [Thermoanaerobaculia bacterium]
MPHTLFLLSPANLSGLRAKQLASPRAQFQAAVKFRSEAGVPIAEAFAFMSALYFRGKIAYARHFANPPEGVLIITSGYGLVPPDWALNAERMKRMQKIDVDVASRSYTKPLRDHAKQLVSMLTEESQVVLLGSVATGKYVDVLKPILGPWLRFPKVFAGLGDMARGGLMLRAVRANKELEYTTLDAPRHRTGGSGKMPETW